jgi:hypothetical protein
MDSKTYEVEGRKIVVTDKFILDIIRKTEKLEMSPEEASEQLKKYLLSDESVDVGEYFRRISLWEKITTEFYISCRGRLTPINERYVEKHGLSGKLTI